jgi:hypothetical protein
MQHENVEILTEASERIKELTIVNEGIIALLDDYSNRLNPLNLPPNAKVSMLLMYQEWVLSQIVLDHPGEQTP